MDAKTLRDSILQQAVQGRLVPQDPSDEPAEALLARIREERAALVKAGKAKAPKGGESVIYRGEGGSWYERVGKAEPVCIDGEVPFDVPDGWAWARLPSIAALNIGKTPSRGNERYWSNGSIPWVSISDMKDRCHITTTKEAISPLALDDCFKRRCVRSGTLIMSFKLTIGKTSIVEFDCTHNEAIISIVPYVDSHFITRNYLLNVIPFAATRGDAKTAIKGSTLNKESISQLLIPIPPLAEQGRIVARVDELMPMVGEYGAMEEEREKLDAALPGSLRKSVLQQAVMGRLVPQDPSDEPAEALLARVREERAALVKAGRAKAPKGGESVIYRGEDGSWYERAGKAEPACIDDEVPFDVPEGWVWARLASIAAIQLGKMLDKQKNRGELKPYLRNENIQWRSINTDDLGEMRFEESELEKFRLRAGDILVCEGGVPGRSAIWMQDVEMYYQKALHRVRPCSGVDHRYLLDYFEYLFTSGRMSGQFTGTTIRHLPAQVFEKVLVPIPPSDEQERIVITTEKLLKCSAILSL